MGVKSYPLKRRSSCYKAKPPPSGFFLKKEPLEFTPNSRASVLVESRLERTNEHLAHSQVDNRVGFRGCSYREAGEEKLLHESSGFLEEKRSAYS